jgi:hypothetical protein
LVCDDINHSHGIKAVDVLSAQVKGVLSITQAFRDVYKKQNPILFSEQGNDLQNPTVDMWSGYYDIPYFDKAPFRSQRLSKNEIIRYTFPYRICSVAPTKKYDAQYVNSLLVNGFFLGGYFGIQASDMWTKSLDPVIKQFIRIRRELRNKKAPGFPYGFRDTVGIEVGNPNLIARIYRNEMGITVLYYAKKDVETKITIDMKALGFSDKDEMIFNVKLKKDKASYFSKIVK